MVRLGDATMTSQGQISVPKKIRVRLNLQKGAKIVFLEDEKGRVIIQEAETPIEFTKEEWQKFLEQTQKEPVTRTHTREGALRHLDRLQGKSSK
jgi:AbrB family looped-hinge helix DNA binding protein